MKKHILLIAMIMLAISAQAQKFSAVCETGQTLYYKPIRNENNKVEITFPGSYGSYWDGYRKPAGKVVLPNSVEYKGVQYDVVSIGMNAFSGCDELTSLTLSKSIADVNSVCFDYCRNLAEIIVDPENPVFDSREHCNAIIKTETNEFIYGCKNAFIPNTVTSIDWYAFRGSGLTSITIPESLKDIRNQAFYDCLITTLVIPSTVESIDYDPWDSEKVTASLTTTDLKLEAGQYYFADEYDKRGLAYGVLFVPCGMKKAYEKTDWGKYFPIREKCK